MRYKALTLAVSLSLLGCSNYAEHLNRSQRYYDENRYEDALSVLRVLEKDTDSLSWRDRARYSYVRGMTDYRLGYRPHARYWLGISQAIEDMHPGSITEEWKERSSEALADLNKDVFGGEDFAASDSSAVEHQTGSAEDLDKARKEHGAGESTESTAPSKSSAPSKEGAGTECREDLDCGPEELCLRGHCIAP